MPVLAHSVLPHMVLVLAMLVVLKSMAAQVLNEVPYCPHTDTRRQDPGSDQEYQEDDQLRFWSVGHLHHSVHPHRHTYPTRPNHSSILVTLPADDGRNDDDLLSGHIELIDADGWHAHRNAIGRRAP